MWRKVAWISIPVFLLLNSAFQLPEVVVFVVAIPFVIAATALQKFKCPKCRECFFYHGLYHPLTQKCVHCGLPKWEDASFVVEEPKVAPYPTPRRRDPIPDPAIAKRHRLAKFLTLVLRDDPKALGLRLDADGWANVDDLVKRSNRYDLNLTRESLAEVLSLSADQRFEWDQPGNRIRFARD